jgi:hypothetical protein
MRVFTVTLISLFLWPLENSAQTRQQTADPYQEEAFSCTGQLDGRLFNSNNEKAGYGRFRIVADLNFDGRDDLILSQGERNGGTGCGNATCDVKIYLKQSNGAYLGVPFGLHPLAMALKMIRPREGQLVIYEPHSASEGGLASFRVSLDSVSLIYSQTLHASDFAQDLALYNSWFKGNLALKVEFARCAKGQLQWTEAYQ